MTLVDIREHVEGLASPDGDYSLICARTGERPFPVSGKRFPNRATAAAAARATEQYRAALRRYDPRLPTYDVIVREEQPPGSRTADSTGGDGRGQSWTLSGPVVTGDGTAESGADLVEFCHGVAAAVFETLSARGHDNVESAVMDAYFDLAEAVTDPDRLCLCLLESMAAELHAGLDAPTQATVLAGAAERLPPADATGQPVSATFDRLGHVGMVGDYDRLPASIDVAGGRRTVEVTVDGYALSPRGGRLPVLPIVVDIHRRQPWQPPTALRAARAADGWRLTIVLGDEGAAGGLATVPVGPD